MISSSEILQQLDSCCDHFTFPMFDNGYVYPAGSKLTAYRDDSRWLIIIEAIGFSYRGGGHNGISNCLHVFGNCLTYPPGTDENNFLRFTTDSAECDTFDEEEYFFLNPHCNTFLLRGKITILEHDRDKYQAAGIDLEEEDRINAFEFLRYLDFVCHDQLIATQEEISARIPNDIPKVLELHEWAHPDIVNEQFPSAHETFVQIANMLETGDLTVYQPTLAPNNHWKNWPEGGSL